MYIVVIGSTHSSEGEGDEKSVITPAKLTKRRKSMLIMTNGVNSIASRMYIEGCLGLFRAIQSFVVLG